VYVIICLGERAEETTMNLLAPVFICARTKRGRQIVIEENPALARVPLFPAPAKPNVQEACGC
jgi:flagellar assembly factor FliW